MSMSSQQVINTTGQQTAPMDPRAAWWVAGYMVAGIVGLVLIAAIFRRHREL